MSKLLKPLLFVLLFAGVAYAAHYGISMAMGFSERWIALGYSLEGMYALQAGISLFVVVMIAMAQFAMPKNVGFIFLGLVLLKAIASYVYINAGLEASEDKFLALQFLIVFFLFLFVDVYMAYRAINQAEPDVETKI